MKSTILMAFCALSLQVAASDSAPTVGDHPESMGFESPDGAKATAIPEAGAVVLGLVGAMMLLRRRR